MVTFLERCWNHGANVPRVSFSGDPNASFWRLKRMFTRLRDFAYDRRTKLLDLEKLSKLSNKTPYIWGYILNGFGDIDVGIDAFLDYFEGKFQPFEIQSYDYLLSFELSAVAALI